MPSTDFGAPLPFKIVFTPAVSDRPAASALGEIEIVIVVITTSTVVRRARYAMGGPASPPPDAGYLGRNSVKGDNYSQ